ncbi:cupin domain-containing protein [Ideonella paludis]
MFVILQGQGHLRVAGELLPVTAGDVITIPPARSTRTTCSTPPTPSSST